ncbi:MAG: hypothetical protein Q4F26_02540 [Atopococcus tabaci]|uniref:V-type ATP synthase subunit E n=1 Tax=Atopococcus tabaci TaxID=269774 RepID=A0AA43UC11_9LACT|nr:hypothetical protein [Atopococcus tabaci]
MKDIENLRSGVIEKITRHGDEKVEAKEQEINEELAAYSAQSDLVKERDFERITQKYNSLLTQNKQSYKNEKRNNLLGVKEGIIGEVIQEALAKLQLFEEEQLVPFIEQALSQIDGNKPHTIQFGDQTIDKISEELLDRLKAENIELIISDQTIQRSSGFIVEQDGIEYNYIFEDLIKEIEPELKVDISKEVF